MKKILILLVASILISTTINAQDSDNRHTGFYLSMALGPSFGPINSDDTLIGKTKMSGVGATFDFKIGGAIKENLILHATLISSALVGPHVISPDGTKVKRSDKISLTEGMLGGGITYYLMPQNVFASVSIGSGIFSIDNQEDDYRASTDRGLSTQLKLGKEWWVSKKWGLGAALTYGMTSANTILNDTYNHSEKMNSSRLGIVFNATLN